MCGRFAIFSSAAELTQAFGLSESPADLSARYNIAPTQRALVVPNRHERRLEPFRWGLIPSWAKDLSIGNRLINARAETLAQKPSFRSAFRNRRCLVPADGFYEWKRSGKSKIPYFIRLKSRKPFAFAGLWETWQPPEGGPLSSFTIVTTECNELLSPIHDRMPVILAPEIRAAWLAPESADPTAWAKWLRPFPADEMEAYVVSSTVNNPAHDGPDLILPTREADQKSRG